MKKCINSSFGFQRSYNQQPLIKLWHNTTITGLASPFLVHSERPNPSHLTHPLLLSAVTSPELAPVQPERLTGRWHGGALPSRLVVRAGVGGRIRSGFWGGGGDHNSGWGGGQADPVGDPQQQRSCTRFGGRCDGVNGRR
jgi:hypothetical protein